MSKLVSLDPDLLQDAIIELRYISDKSYEVIVGLMYSRLIPLGFEHLKSARSGANPLALNLNLSNVFQKEAISIRCQGNSFIINFTEGYPKWDKYFLAVKESLVDIFDKDIVQSIHRIGLRFINAFESNVFDNISDSVKRVKVGDFTTKNTRLTTEILDEKHRIIVNIGNGYPSGKEETISLLDIDIIFEKESIKSLDVLLREIDNCHSKEKDIFQSLVNKEFLDKHKAKYE